MQASHARQALRACLIPTVPFLLAACQFATSTPASSPVPPAPAVDLAARGEYLVRVAGCNDCIPPATPSARARYPGNSG